MFSESPCAVCNELTSNRCGGCERIWYCCRDHSRADWRKHKTDCNPLPSSHTFAMAHTPDSTVYVTAIHFPVNDKNPILINVQCIPPPDLSVSPCPVPVVEEWFRHLPRGLILTQGLNHEPLRFPLHVMYELEALSQASPINRSVEHITSGQARRPWCGSVVVLKFSGSRRQGYSEATLNDLPALSAYFLEYA